MRVSTAAGLAVVVLLTGCHDLYEADPLRSARADSSAAGYMVGESPAPSGSVTTLASRDGSGSRGQRMHAADPSPGVNIARPATPAGSPRGPASSAASAATSSTHASAPHGDSARTGGTTRSTGATGDSTAAARPATPSPVDGSLVVDGYLSFNPAARTVWLNLIAGLDGGNGSLNFNGGFEGAHTLIVPAGWRVELRFQNRDRELSHSAIVVKAVDPIPMLAPPPAFPNAFTLSLENGIVEGREDVVRFSADTEGRYAILCAVPGHGQSGMWMRLEVRRNAAIPEYRRR